MLRSGIALDLSMPSQKTLQEYCRSHESSLKRALCPENPQTTPSKTLSLRYMCNLTSEVAFGKQVTWLSVRTRLLSHRPNLALSFRPVIDLARGKNVQPLVGPMFP